MPTTSTRKARRHREPAEAPLRAVVQWACRARGAPSAARLRAFARAGTRGATEVTLRIVGAAEGRRLNHDYRGRDYATNVLAFGYGRGVRRDGAPLRGDVVICHPVVTREARAQHKSMEAHYAHLVVHAMLHLRGYDHQVAREARRMARAEVRALRRLGFSSPYRAAGSATVE
jgi:probable rRNA maturation factor